MSEPASFEYRPALLSAVAAVGAAFLAVAALVALSLYASVAAGAGAVVLAAGLVTGTRRVATAGVAVMFAALLAGALAADGVVAVVVAALCTLVAYDAGQYAIRLGGHVGAAGSSTRAERRHLGTTLGLTAGCVVVGGGVFSLAPETQPGLVALALVLAAVLLVSGLAQLDGERG